MSTQAMFRAVIAGASSAMDTVNANRLGLNRLQNTTVLSSREVSVGSSV